MKKRANIYTFPKLKVMLPKNKCKSEKKKKRHELNNNNNINLKKTLINVTHNFHIFVLFLCMIKKLCEELSMKKV